MVCSKGRSVVATIGRRLARTAVFLTLVASSTYGFPGKPLALFNHGFLRRQLSVIIHSESVSDADSTQPTRRKTQYTIDDDVCPPTRPHLLQSAVEKACTSIDIFLERKPIAKHTQQAFDDLKDLISSTQEPSQRPIAYVLDSGCGTGKSTKVLSEIHTDCIVIGIDRSFVRLNKNQASSKNSTMDDDDIDSITEMDEDPKQTVSTSSKRSLCVQLCKNAYLVRAELVDFWRCCQNDGWDIRHHYLLYPNPYPTHTRLTQRWYAHPSFPLLLGLGSATIVVRSNWLRYLEEFASAVELAHGYYSRDSDSNFSKNNVAEPYLSSAKQGPKLRIDLTQAWTNFEKKYDDVGEQTYELRLHTK